MTVDRLRDAAHDKPGWAAILIELADALDQLGGVEIHDVKEKFATLRVAATVTDPAHRDAADQLIDAAEKTSARTCIRCGAPGHRDDAWHWILTLCGDCSARRTEERVAAALSGRRRTRWPRPHLAHATGWAQLLTELRRDLDRIDPELFVMRVDAPDGVLRLQFWASRHELREQVQARIDETVAATDRTCSRCGDPGEGRTVADFWTQPLCESCDDLRRFRQSYGLWHDGRTVDDLAAGWSRWPVGAPVLLQLPDGQLVEVGYPEQVQVVCVRSGEELTWVPGRGCGRRRGRWCGTGDDPETGATSDAAMKRRTEAMADTFASLTTLRVGGPIKNLVTATSIEALTAAVRGADATGEPVLLVGGGSNLLVSDDGFDGTVVLVRTRGVTIDGDLVTVAAGENWDGFVAEMTDHGRGQLAPLSGIPGTVGAAPIQNIGAYGADVAEHLLAVTVYDRQCHTVREISTADCGFGYRTSIFKHDPRFVVLSVTFWLPAAAAVPVRYPQLADALGVAVPADTVREAVLKLRRSKAMVLDAADHDTWSAGSFFINPVVADGSTGQAALSTKHTLAITNRGGATAADLLELAAVIRSGVAARFGVGLEPEPHLVGCGLR